MLDDRAPAHAMVFSRILRKGQLNRHTRYRPNVPTSRPDYLYHTKHCHAAVVSLGGLTHR